MSIRVVCAFCVGILFALGLAAPANSLDSVDDALCVCVDDVINTGDYVSCVSKMTRRLEVKGVISSAERSDLVSSAADADLDSIQAFCDDQSGAGELWGFGTSYSIGNAFCPAWRPLGPQCFVIGDLRLWNNTIDRIVLVSDEDGPDRGCLFKITVLDDQGNVVRRDDVECADFPREVVLEPGDEIRFFDSDANVPMLYENADPVIPFPAGDAFRSGRYEIVVTWNLSGPESKTGTFDHPGERLEIRVPVRIGTTP